MRRNCCNLELCLFPPYHSRQRHPNMLEGNSDHMQSPIQNCFQNQQQQPLTIFYDGKICATHVTELQAKWILMVANKEVQERVKTENGSSEACTPTMVQSPSISISTSTGLSMKRSLQRFLQKRKIRVQQASPYYH